MLFSCSQCYKKKNNADKSFLLQMLSPSEPTYNNVVLSFSGVLVEPGEFLDLIASSQAVWVIRLVISSSVLHVAYIYILSFSSPGLNN